jgi:short-subunit dehydrogenase
MADRPVVVITGASAGVGRAVARRFAQEGYLLGLLARGRKGLEGAKREAEELGTEALVLPTDVACPIAVEEAAAAVEEAFGPIDVWINNATATVFAPFSNVDPEEFRRVTEVTYLGTAYGTMAALKRMQPRNQGMIVQVGSALAYRGIPLQSAYCGAKHAIQGLSESIRAELLHEKSNVHIAMVQLPALNTPQFGWSRNKMGKEAMPVPPIYEPEVAAEAILWAAENAPREINVGGTTTLVVNLNKFFPGLGDHYLGATGYASQMLDEPVEEGRPDNLFAPVDEDRGARGRFSGQAKVSSKELWATTHKAEIGLAAGAVALAAAAGVAVAKRRKAGREDTRQTEAPTLEAETPGQESQL